MKRKRKIVLKCVDVYSGSADSIITGQDTDAVIIKATQGTGYVNPKCNHQTDLARSLGRQLGWYHYASGGNPEAEADYFINNISNYVKHGVLALDWESYQNNAWGDRDWCRRFVNRVHERTGVWCLIYVQQSALAQVANIANDCGLWCAWYASMNWNSWTLPNANFSVVPWPVMTGWQFTGGDMDRSVFYLTREGWDRLARGDNAPSADPQPVNPQPVRPTAPQPAPTKSWVDAQGVTWYREDGTFTITVPAGIVLRWGASVESTEIAVLPEGSVVKYDAFCHSGGYVWIRQPRGDGQYGYLPTGESRDGRRISYWGRFSK